MRPPAPDRDPGGQVSGRRTLVAGIGNVFLGDDGFGVAVAGRLRPGMLPDGVDVGDYGIRGVHLAYDLLDGRYQRLILVDAVQLHEAPGTLAVLDVANALSTPDRPAPAPLGPPAVDAHAMDPATVLHTLHGLGARVDRVLVVGCQPARVAEGMELSAPVRAAVGDAVQLLVDLVGDRTVEPPDHAASHAAGRTGQGGDGGWTPSTCSNTTTGWSSSSSATTRPRPHRSNDAVWSTS